MTGEGEIREIEFSEDFFKTADVFRLAELVAMKGGGDGEGDFGGGFGENLGELKDSGEGGGFLF